jgi:hypothetical protein
MRSAARWSLGKVVLYLLLPCLFWLVPPTFLEAHPIPCVYRVLFGVRCPGCGMSRAISCATHGRFRDAWRYNHFVVLILPLLSYEWGKLILGEWAKYRALRAAS